MSDAPTPISRPLTPADAPAVLAVVHEDEERVTGRASRLTEGDVRDWWQWTDLAADSWAVTDPASGRLTGAVWLDRPGDGLGVSFPLGTAWDLLGVVEQRAVAAGLRRLHVGAVHPDPRAEAATAARGLTEVRRFYEMAITLDGPPTVRPLPEGLELAGVTEADARDFHSTIDESFADHWEHHGRPFEEWWATRSADPDLDLSWWFVVRDGHRSVAAIRNVPARNGGVYVATLGVLRSHRGRGLARALLLHTFARAWDAGMPRVSLGVDATSPTGATALYRSVGMGVELESVVREKRLS